MLLSRETHPAHLTYCTNVHPGESLDDLIEHVRGPVDSVRRELGGQDRFGVGLRVAADAATLLDDPDAVERLGDALRGIEGYVFTLNGFPYGNFHHGRVKEQVYLPDWSSPARVEYTNRLARALSALLPETVNYGSVSTVPGCFRPLTTPKHRDLVEQSLLAHVAELWRLRESTGKVVVLALEPEPACMLETTAEAVTFIEGLRRRDAVARLAAECGVSSARAETVLAEHLGVCLDACHSAVQFEDPTDAVDSLRRAGIRIAKLQLSAAVLAADTSEASLDALAHLDEPTYLHQTVTRVGDEIRRYLDVPDALRDVRAGQQSRVHYHVPIYDEHFGRLQTTRSHLESLLELQARAPFTEHLEVETYTWGIFRDAPTPDRLPTLIAREMAWARARLERSTESST